MTEAPADSTVIGEVRKWVRVDPFTAPRRAPVLRDSLIHSLPDNPLPRKLLSSGPCLLMLQ
ncbi:hypothetical protein FQA47_023876 [Oryzias melastigma]|uniref:Uncharacterized protein n=1 Tax=Oryzias melastigma TaxID=30732 RepID=A0A834C705_ORYME|nr:hypothetical protein FQA47_023876 [Oryzias melastigma]